MRSIGATGIPCPERGNGYGESSGLRPMERDSHARKACEGMGGRGVVGTGYTSGHEGGTEKRVSQRTKPVEFSRLKTDT